MGWWDVQSAHFVRVSSLLRVRRTERSGGTPSSSSEAEASIPPALRAGAPAGPPSASARLPCGLDPNSRSCG